MKRAFTLVGFSLLAFFSFLVDGIGQCSQQICTTQPPPALCAEDACIMCDPCLINGYQGSTVPGSNTCDVPGPFCGSIENNQWFAFLAPPSGQVTFSFTVTTCTGVANGSGIQAEIYSTNTCNDFVSVSNCWSPGAQQNGDVTATGLVPYCTYYLMIDGWAGDFCDFTINTTDCMVPPTPQPITITGPQQVCPGATVQYTMQPEPEGGCGNNSNVIVWTGIEPYGQIVGPNDEATVTVQWLTAGVTQVSVSYDNVCFGGSFSPPLPVSIQPIPPTPEEHDVCLGECVTCAGVYMCTPGLWPVTLTSWLGCDSVVNCLINPIAPVFTDNGSVTICHPQTYSICGEIFDECGAFSATCDNWQGCDSTVIVDLAILHPIANIATPGILNCAPGSSVILNGSTSSVASDCAPNATTTYAWTGPAGGISGSATGSSVTATQPGQYCLTVTHSRGGVNCNNQKCVTVLKDDDVPQTPQVSGPTAPCPNTPVTYTVAPVGQPAPTSYTWSVSNGTPFTTSPDGTSMQVTWPSSGSVQVCVTANNDCGPSNQACMTVNVAVGPVATLSGSGSVCPNSNDDVNLTISLTGTSPWTVNYTINGMAQNPLTINSSPYTLVATQVGDYELVSVVGGAGCTGTVNGTGTVAAYPVPTATLSGTGSICQGSGQTAGLTISLTGTPNWTIGWAVDGVAQAPVTATSSPYTLTIGQAQAGNITLTSLTDGNGCNGTVGGSGTVTLNTAPTVSNIQVLCDANNVEYTVSFTINGGNPASYSVAPANGTLSGNMFTSNPILSGTGYSFTVNDVNNCNPVTVAQPLVICDCDTEAGDMETAQQDICGDGPVSPAYDPTDQFFDGNDSLVFVLHSGNGITIQPPVIGTFTTPTVSFGAGMAYGTTYYLSAVVGDDNGNGSVDLNDPCLSVSQGTPIVFYEIPSATLTGNPVICEGETASFTVDFEGVGPFSITYTDATGPHTVNGITSDPYTLNLPDAVSSTVCLTGMSDVNCPGTATGCGDITANQGVAATFEVECDLSGTFFNVIITISGGDPGSYFVDPPNGTLVGNVFTSNDIPDGQGFLFTVDDANGCDPQTLQQTEVICDCTTEVGVMTGSAIFECGNGPVTTTYDPTDEVLDPDDIQGYLLHTNSGANAGTVIDYNPTAPSFSFDPATMNYGTTYYISAVVGNNAGGSVDFADPCLAVAQGTPVTFYEIPTATISGGENICPGDSTVLSIALTGDQPWSVTVDGQTFTGITTPDFSVTVVPAATTTYTVTASADANCAATLSGQATVVVNGSPTASAPVATCDLSTGTFVVTFTISGGDPASYTVLPTGAGTLNGNTFTSNPINSGETYTFTVNDANNCAPIDVTGTQDCVCETFAGTMSLPLKRACIGNPITVNNTQNPFLDADDILVYYLHTSMDNTLGTVLAISTTPTFNFDPATMVTGTNYYVSAVAGNPDGAGGVDLDDPCLSIAQGTPVRWNALPTVQMVATDAICEGGEATVTMTFNGVGPSFTINYLVGSTPFSTTISSSPHSFTISPTATTTVTMVSILDIGSGCSSPSNELVTVFVSQNVDAGNPTDDFEFCDGISQTINLADNLSGEDAGGTWTDDNFNAVPGSFNVDLLPPGNHVFHYLMATSAPCVNDTATLNVLINPTPVADAGTDKATNCDITEAQIGGPNTTPGMDYAWTGGTVSDPNSATPIAGGPGTYTLTVTNPQGGCSDSDDVTVTETITDVQPHVTVSGVSCFGDEDGFITVDSVSNGLAPYLYSFDGGPFGTQSQFTNLSPGNHTLIVMDAAGCEREIQFLVPEPEEVTVEIVLDLEGGDTILTLGDTVRMGIVVTPPFDSLDQVSWLPADAVDCDTCEYNLISPSTQTTYTVRVDKDGCTDDDQVTVFVKKLRPVYIPNAFSPNDDGTNDQFMIFAGKQVTKVKSFLVFSRWGETVYQYFDFLPNDPAFGWNGTHRGQPLDPAVFIWFAEIEFVDGKVQLYEGEVNLVR